MLKTLLYIAFHMQGLFVNRVLLGLILMRSRDLTASLKTLFTRVEPRDLLHA